MSREKNYGLHLTFEHLRPFGAAAMQAPATPSAPGAGASAKSYASAPPPFMLRPFYEVWRAQFRALVVRALYMIRYRVASSLAVVFLPAVALAALMALSNAIAVQTGAPTQLALPRCTAFNIYYAPYAPADRPCVTVLFAPDDNAAFTDVMQRLASATGLRYGVDVVGASSATAAAHLLFDDATRQYDAAVVFAPNASALNSGEAQYEIWYNQSLPQLYALNGLDTAWRYVGVSGRHAALQLAVDAAIVAHVAGADRASGVPTLDATVSAFPDNEAANTIGASGGDGLLFISGATFIMCGIVAGVLFAMMLVTGEKSRRLVGQLRTIGLYESAYWASWLTAYVPVLTAMAIVLPLVGGVGGANLSLFVHTDFSVHFVAALLVGLASLANALCCAACVRRQGCVMFVSLLQFAIAVILTVLMAVIGIYPYMYTIAPRAATAFVSLFPSFHYGRLVNIIMLHIVGADQSQNQQSSQVEALAHSLPPLVARLARFVGLDESAVIALRSLVLGLGAHAFEPPPAAAGAAAWTAGANASAHSAWHDASSAWRGHGAGAPGFAPGPALGAGAGLLGLSANSYVQYTWDDLTTVPPSVNVYVEGLPATVTDYTAAYSLWMLVALTAGYLALAWYFGQVMTGDLGAAEYVWFPLSPYYWGFASLPATLEPGDTIARVQALSAQEGSVRLHKLSKMFAQTTAVKEVSLMLPPGQLIALLGQNGAGKSTLVNVMSGLISPTHGEAFLFGKSIRNETAVLRDIMGTCPQDDLLWEELSARAHIELFARFRGVPDHELDAHVDARLQTVGLLEVAGAGVDTFSGGMKRRLSVAMASVGDPRIIFLDERKWLLQPKFARPPQSTPL